MIVLLVSHWQCDKLSLVHPSHRDHTMCKPIFVETMQNGGIGPWMQLMGFDKVKINKTNITKQNSVFPEIESESEG